MDCSTIHYHSQVASTMLKHFPTCLCPLLSLTDHIAQIFVDYCKRCTIVAGAVATAAFFRNCEFCRFKVACGQLRTRDCVNCDVLVQVPGQPIIETSQGMRFGPLLTAYPGFEGHLEAAGLRSRFEGQQGKCRWTSVYDFSPGDPPGGGHWSCLSRAEAESVSASFPATPHDVPVSLPRDRFPGEDSSQVVAAVVATTAATLSAAAADQGGAAAMPKARPAEEMHMRLQAVLDEGLVTGAHDEAVTAASRLLSAVAGEASFQQIEDAISQLEALQKETAEKDVQLHAELLAALRSCVVWASSFRAQVRGAPDPAAGLLSAVRARLEGAEGARERGRVWLVALGTAVPVAASAANRLECQGVGRVSRVQTGLVRGRAQLLVACDAA